MTKSGDDVNGDVDIKTVRLFATPPSGIIGVATLWIVAALYLTKVESLEPFMPWLWPVLYGAAGLATLAVFIRPGSKATHLTATGLGLASLLLRPVSLAARWWEGDPRIIGSEAAFRGLMYLLTTYLWYCFCEASLEAWRLNEVLKRRRTRRE